MTFLEELIKADDETELLPDPEVLPEPEPEPQEITPPAQDILPTSSSNTGQVIYGVPQHIMDALGIGAQTKSSQIAADTAAKQIAESARQYNETSARLKLEFEKTLELELQKIGLDRERIEEGKREFNIQTSGYMDYDPNKGMPTPDYSPPADFARQAGPIPKFTPTPQPQAQSQAPSQPQPAATSMMAPPSLDIPTLPVGGF